MTKDEHDALMDEGYEACDWLRKQLAQRTSAGYLFVGEDRARIQRVLAEMESGLLRHQPEMRPWRIALSAIQGV